MTDIAINMKFFASIRDMTEVPDAVLRVPDGCDSERLVEHLLATYPNLEALVEQLPTILAVNHAFLPVGESVMLKDGDEVALIPPISGG